MADWHVGQMVVCVDARAAADGYVPPLTKGLIYEIAAIGVDDFGNVGFELVGVPNPERPGFCRRYRARRFRPVRKTSIDIFRSLLTPSGDDGAATPRSLPVVPSLPDRVEQGSCHYSRIDEPCVLPPGTTSRRATLAAGLARYADGRPLLSIHVKSSALSFSELSPVDSKETSRCRRISPSSRSIAPQIRSVL